ncbi:LexA family protein [Helcococcus kunzii]|uniref:LexA family protein n=1 Tax=Helcococcus kunzii TaxID=40091 RepID=UPI00389E964E
MSIGLKLKNIREELGYTQNELAKKLNLSKSAISMYERDERTPSIEILLEYAKLFDVSLDYISNINSKNVMQEGLDYARINVYGEVPAGIPIEAIEDIQDFEDISFKEFDKNKEYIGLKVKGDSMYPKYLHGDTIIIEVTPCFNNGDEVVVYINGYNATLKKIIQNSDGSITLMPLNQNYAPRTYGIGDEPITVLGVVKQIRRNV